MTAEYSKASASLAANQGLYNGFLAAGLFWGLSTDQFAVKMFFLICVVIAGIYGGLTARRTILYIQALPGFTGADPVVSFFPSEFSILAQARRTRGDDRSILFGVVLTTLTILKFDFLLSLDGIPPCATFDGRADWRSVSMDGS